MHSPPIGRLGRLCQDLTDNVAPDHVCALEVVSARVQHAPSWGSDLGKGTTI